MLHTAVPYQQRSWPRHINGFWFVRKVNIYTNTETQIWDQVCLYRRTRNQSTKTLAPYHVQTSLSCQILPHTFRAKSRVMAHYSSLLGSDFWPRPFTQHLASLGYPHHQNLLKQHSRYLRSSIQILACTLRMALSRSVVCDFTRPFWVQLRDLCFLSGLYLK